MEGVRHGFWATADCLQVYLYKRSERLAVHQINDHYGHRILMLFGRLLEIV